MANKSWRNAQEMVSANITPGILQRGVNKNSTMDINDRYAYSSARLLQAKLTTPANNN
ncbi:MAG: hypothetical protein V4628_15920 [Pseudomonadota bacterium]